MVSWWSISPVETRHPDGRTTFRDVSGNLQTQHPDGKEVWEMTSGNRTTLYPDGRRVHEDTSGTVRKVFPDGMERSEFADGTRHARYPNGREEVRTSSGHFEIRFPDGRKLITTPEGHTVTVHPDGRQLSELADGTTVETYPDGSKIQRNPTGEVLRISADGGRRTTFANGSEVIRRADGARVVRSPGGAVAETYPDGRRVDRDGRGNRIESFPDGRKVHTDAAGNRVERLRDGTLRKTSADPYRYLGEVRSDLLEMDEVSTRVLPGADVHLSGMVTGDGVRTLQAAAFRLPDGDVSDINVGRDGTRFHARLKAGKAGHIIVQVSAEMEDEEIAILYDHMLTVGDPPPLEARTVVVPPYPGSNAAVQRLLQLTNEARKRLGRQGLPEDARMSQVAREHLVEMLSLGFVGHRSPTSGTIADRLDRKGIWFRTTTENLGHAASIEELHDQLMASAGHRRSILDPTWTRIGLAVTRNWGEVWGVQVFYRD